MQTPHVDRLDVLEHAVVTFDDDGVITAVAADRHADVDVDLGDAVVLIPGYVDTHVHAPQWPQVGTGLDLPLDQWLFEYTFPLEARYDDVDFARRVWDDLVPSLLAHGTTTAVYYGARNVEATAELAEACVRHGQRALVGRVAMDHPDGTPEYYRDESAVVSVDLSARSVERIAALADPLGLVAPVVTPRFIPSCTDASLEGHAELAASAGVRIQTHCSEGDWEHRHVFDRCGVTDTAALDRFGLLREHTVLAHATHLDDADRSLIAAAGAGIAHCPLSNAYFSNRPFAARAALDAGVRVGLGTDIAGGPSPSLIGQCEHAIVTSQRVAEAGAPAARIDAVTAFWMATVGGAEVTGLPVGLLAPGRQFDAVAISLDRLGVDRGLDGPQRVFDKIVHLSGHDDVRTVWVAGKQVVSR